MKVITAGEESNRWLCNKRCKPQSIISNGVECGQGFGGFWFQGIYVCVLIFKES